MSWQQKAACRGHDPELWFSEDPGEIWTAKAICARCPVHGECGDDAEATDQSVAYGIRAGLTGRQRSEARRDRLRQRMTAA